MNHRELQKLVASGESDRLEFKKTTGLRVDAAKTLCAMLNGSGGVVLFGVKNSGEMTGQDVSDQTLQDIAQEFRRFEPPAFPEIETVSLENGKTAISVRVDDGKSKPYTFDGRPYVRNGPTTSIMPQQEYERLLIERLHATRRWENSPVAKGIGLGDLDADEVRRVVDNAVRSGRLQRPRSLRLENLLRGLGVLVDGRLVNAAVALFGKGERVKALYPQLALRVARFRGKDRLADFADNRQFWGHGFALLQHAEAFLMDHIFIAGRVESGNMRREDRPAYPPRATREALANAICHRDYSIPGGAVTVALYDDHLEVSNPGALHFGLSPEKLVQPHESKPWNPIIADAFYKSEIIEQWGTGTLNILDWCRENGNPPPAWAEQAGAVTVTFAPAAPLEPESRPETQPESQPESQPSSPERSLADRVLALLQGRMMTKAELSQELGQKAVSGQLNKVIRELIAAKQIERTIPGKPQSRLQKYRLAENGKQAAKKQ
ncbi:MAG: putative DNA binding domain-containing protein [Planctomycetota bacterium]|nr:putative DNA binding domain-containing protein [Planctomycetota bacterium]